MDHLQAKQAITETLYKFAYALDDDLNKDVLFSLLRPDVPLHFDISAQLGMPPAELMPENWYAAGRGSLGGFDWSQHLLSNPLVTLESGEKKAEAKTYVTAHHALEEGGKAEVATEFLTWTFGLEVWEGKWVIRSWVIGRSANVKNEVFDKAMEKAYARAKEGFRRAKKT